MDLDLRILQRAFMTTPTPENAMAWATAMVRGTPSSSVPCLATFTALGQNVKEISLDGGRIVLLLSYGICVAAIVVHAVPESGALSTHARCYRTATRHSPTTDSHISKFLNRHVDLAYRPKNEWDIVSLPQDRMTDFLRLQGPVPDFRSPTRP
jgi:hypothetical protein